MQNKIIVTEDGSHTVYVPSLNEHYHSTHGAINESMHVYINSGLQHHQAKEINLLEIGFGTGLNAFLSLAVAIQKGIKINYFGIEKYPLVETEYQLLNYPEQIFPEYSSYFKNIHDLSWDVIHRLAPEYRILKIKADLKNISYEGLPHFDLIYFDAFAPTIQPEMWSHEVFEQIANHTNQGGIIVTYCSKGSIRRLLDQLGFQMERLSGPIGKIQILRGTKR